MPFQLNLGSATEGPQPLDLARQLGDAVQRDLDSAGAGVFEMKGRVGFHLTSETVTGRTRENGNGMPPFPAARAGWQ